MTAQATLQDYKLQLKQLLELDGEQEMQVYLPALGDENVLSPLPTKTDVFRSAVALRPEIEASKLSVEASELGIGIAKSGYLPSVSLTVDNPAPPGQPLSVPTIPAEATSPSASK